MTISAPAPRRPSSRKELHAHPAVRNYNLLCVASLFILVVILVDQDLGWWCLLPALIGTGALLAHWSLGPPLVLLSLGGLMLAPGRYRPSYPWWTRNQVPTVTDLLLCAAVLAYVLGHYRLLSLVRHVFPPDPRRLRGGTLAESANRRSADLVGPWELTLLVLSLPLWTALSVVIWGWLIDRIPPLGIPPQIWRGLLAAWGGALALAVTAGVAGYLRHAIATPEESLLFLQDQVWRKTLREQSILNRWLVWARLRAQRGEETP